MPRLTPRIRWLAVGAAVVVFGLALSLSAGLTDARPRVPQGPATAEIDEVRIAFIERLDSDAAADRVLPALHGIELALDAAANAGEPPVDVELVRIDPWDDPELLQQALDDPRFVASFGAPYLSGQLRLGERLGAAGLPFVTLSANGPDLSSNGWRGWFRGVASVDDEAAALARWLHDDGVRADEVCLAGDASPGTAPFLHAVAGRLAGRAATLRLGPDLALSGLVARIRRTGCDVVVWGGEGETGGAVAAALAGHRRRPVVAGGSNLRDPAFDETAGPAARGAISASSCTELSTETRLAAQRFVQDYQSQFARPPGTCAVEAWDLARWLLRAIGDGGVTRPSLLEQLGASTPFDGVAGTFDFAADGEPAGDSALPRLWRFEAGRWAPAG